MTRVVFIGPPGAGKGTQAVKFASTLGIPHISTGDLIRAEKKAGTPLGMEVQKYADEGKLVPDEIVLKIVAERLEEDDAKKGFLFDGFPRTIAQAKSLDRYLKIHHMPLSVVVFFDVPDDVIVERICGRRTCRNTGNVYHVRFNPPPASGRDENGKQLDLYQREDDTEEKVRVRLKEYEENTAALIPYYKESGVFQNIDANRDISEIEADLADLAIKLSA
ncbi:MAG: adenylate kinase [Planctomycetes bacterium]|nr:adenylate kinase [Planctomycetota bacterium]